MKEQLHKILGGLILLICGFTISADAGGISFKIQDNNIPAIEKQSVITGAALSADYDGEGVNNDVALIDQSRGIVFLLLFNKDIAGARSVVTININSMFTARYLPTSATAFIDARTGLQNIAITAISPDSNQNGKLIIGVNDGSGLFGLKEQFQSFDLTRGATDINHGDFNLDGFDDLAFIDFRENRAAVLLNNGTNGFVMQSSVAVGNYQPVSAIVGDFNDDDYLDLVVLSRLSQASITDKGPPTSAVTTLFGNSQGQLTVGTDILVPSFGISMVGGLVDPLNRPTLALGSVPKRQNYDVNLDGLPDLTVLSTGFELGSAVLTTFQNNSTSPGNFILKPQSQLQLSIPRPEQVVLSESAENGGAELVSGNGIGDTPLGVGGAYHALGVGDFDGDATFDLVVAGTIVPKTGVNAGINFRAVAYINNLPLDRLFPVGYSIGYGKARAFKLAELDPTEGKDSFVAAIPGIFAGANNLLSGVLQVSLNGNIWIDTNQSNPCEYTATINIDRSSFNAPLGSGRKLILTAGQTAEVTVKTSRLDNGGIKVRLGDAPLFVSAFQKNNNEATIKIDTSQFASLSEELRANVAVVVESVKGSCGIVGPPESPGNFTTFTLIVRPNSAPIISAIANRSIEVGKTEIVQLTISDPENQSFTTSVKCDRGNFTTINGSIITLAPTLDDIGMINCKVTVKDSIGLSSSTSFNVNVIPVTGAPVIELIQDQNVVNKEVREINVTATDPANQSIRLLLVSAPVFVTFVDNGKGRGTIRIAPNLSDTEGGRVVLQAINTAGLIGQQAFNISLTPPPVITNVFFDSHSLSITGFNFGPTSMVMVNNRDLTKRITNLIDAQISISGNRKKLKLVTGANQITVTVNGVVSNTFLFNLFAGDKE